LVRYGHWILKVPVYGFQPDPPICAAAGNARNARINTLAAMTLRGLDHNATLVGHVGKRGRMFLIYSIMGTLINTV